MPPEKEKTDILVIGELNMDLIFSGMSSFPELGKEKIAGKMDLTLGSSSAIFATNCARLGLSVKFCGMIGDDNFGEKIMTQLQAFDIDTSLIVLSKKHNTGLTAIIRQTDDRAMLTYPGSMEHFSLADIPQEAFQHARHLHISSIFLQPLIKKDLSKIIQKAKLHGMTISIDPQWDPNEKWDLDLNTLLQSIDFFLPNEAEFLRLTDSETLEDGMKQLPPQTHGSVIVKRGIKGAAFLDGKSIVMIPAFLNNQPIDMIGAGDSFDTGFIYRFLREESIEQCIRFGNLVGAISTTKTGGTAAITSLDELLQIAREKFSTNQFNDLTK